MPIRPHPSKGAASIFFFKSPPDRHTTLPIIIRCITTPIKRPTNTGDRSPKNQIIAIQDLAYPVRQTALLTIPSFVHRLYSLYINTSTDPLTGLPRQVKALDSEVRRREQEEGAQRKESASAEKVVGQDLKSGFNDQRDSALDLGPRLPCKTPHPHRLAGGRQRY